MSEYTNHQSRTSHWGDEFERDQGLGGPILRGYIAPVFFEPNLWAGKAKEVFVFLIWSIDKNQLSFFVSPGSFFSMT
jgi:hypothetical protein